ncbi:MAG TPA: FAD-binding oxidoreductase [Verrucomicrobiae bacterium]|nr:FAD-binding oxidoreductase [Verrucomicrobiae bacterium]
MNLSTRRNFIKRTVAASGTLGFATGCQHLAVTDSNDLSRAEIDRLRAKLKGRLILPADPSYESARRVFYWNAGTERRPRVIVQCAAEEDVLRAVEFAQRHELEVAARAGGHSHLGWGCSNGLVIDLSGMKRMAIDPLRRTARAEGGVLSGEMARAAGQHGLAPVLGQCPGVGASGLILGGGLGWLSGLHGASCDNLLSARMVASDGRVLAADSERHPDLFWALRGAGANFGVTTAFECRLHPIGPVTGGDIHYSVRDARLVLRFFRELMDEAPDGFQATLNLTPGDRGVFVSLCHAGSENEAERILKSLRAIAPPAKEFVKRQEFAELAERPAATNPANTPPPAFRGIQTAYRDQLSDDLIDIMVDRLSRASAEAIMGVSHYMHGQVCRLAPSATAFPLRQTGGLNVRLAYTWNDSATGQRLTQWADESLRLLRPSADERIYANFQTYQARNGAAAVYAANFSRLAAIKHKYDPENFFRRNSNIPPTRNAGKRHDAAAAAAHQKPCHKAAKRSEAAADCSMT